MIITVVQSQNICKYEKGMNRKPCYTNLLPLVLDHFQKIHPKALKISSLTIWKLHVIPKMFSFCKSKVKMY